MPKHITKDGDTLLVEQMDPDHLINTLNYWLRQLVQCRNILEAAPKDIEGGTVLFALNPSINSKETQERAKRGIAEADAKLMPYVFEAALRGIPISSALQNAYGRKGQVPGGYPNRRFNGTIGEVISNNVEVYVDNDDDDDELDWDTDSMYCPY